MGASHAASPVPAAAAIFAPPLAAVPARSWPLHTKGFRAGPSEVSSPPSAAAELAVELEETLAQSGRSGEVLELGQVLDSGRRKRRIQYNTS